MVCSRYTAIVNMYPLPAQVELARGNFPHHLGTDLGVTASFRYVGMNGS